MNGMVNKDVGLALRKDGLPAGLEYYPVMPEMSLVTKLVLAVGLVYEPLEFYA